MHDIPLHLPPISSHLQRQLSFEHPDDQAHEGGFVLSTTPGDDATFASILSVLENLYGLVPECSV